MKVPTTLSTTFISTFIDEIIIKEGVFIKEIIHPDDIMYINQSNCLNGTQLLNVENPQVLNVVLEGTIGFLYPISFDCHQMNSLILLKLLESNHLEEVQNLNDMNKLELPLYYYQIN